MRYSLGIELGGDVVRAAVATDDDRLHDVGETPLAVGLSEAGEAVVGSGALALGADRHVQGFRDRLGQAEPLMLGRTPYGVEALLAQAIRSAVDTVAAEAGEWPARVAVTHPDTWGDYQLDLLDQAAAMAEVGEVVLVKESEARAAADPEGAATPFALARGVARWARPQDQVAPVEPGGLPVSGRTAASVLAALGGGAALGVAGATASAGAAGAGAAARIADFGGGRTMADFLQPRSMADFAGQGRTMSDFGDGSKMSDFGGSQPAPPQGPAPLETAARAGRRVPKAAIAAAAAVVAVVVAGGIALASRGGDAPDETEVGTDTTAASPTTDPTDTTAARGERNSRRELVPFVFAGSTFDNRIADVEVGDTVPRTRAYLAGGATGVAVADDGRIFILDGANFGALWEVDGDDMTLLFEGDPNGPPRFDFSNSLDLAVRGSGDDVELFIANGDANRIVRYVPATKELETWGTGGKTGDSLVEDGTPATEALFARPVSLDVDDDGNVWMVDLNKPSVVRIGTDDKVTVIAGRGSDAPSDGAKAIDVRFPGLKAIAVDESGRAVVASHNELWSINTDGTIQKIAGTGDFPSERIPHGDGGPALRAAVSASDLAFGPDGTLYIAGDGVPRTVRTIDANGRIDRIAGRDAFGGSTPATAMRWFPDSISVDEDSNVYVGETLNGVTFVRRVASTGVPEDTAAFRFDIDDRVGRADDLKRVDASPDHVLEVIADGDIEDVLITVGDCGSRDPDWDTVTGNDIPGVGVAKGAANIENDDSGDLPTMRLTEPTLLTLYFEDDGTIEPGDRLCVTLVRPGGGEDEEEFVIRGFGEGP